MLSHRATILFSLIPGKTSWIDKPTQFVLHKAGMAFLSRQGTLSSHPSPLLDLSFSQHIGAYQRRAVRCVVTPVYQISVHLKIAYHVELYRGQ